MSGYLAQPLTPQQQKRLSMELYALLGKQVKRYHTHYHKGDNSSVPTETARELMDSIQFTLAAAGGYRPGEPLEDQLARGQAVLEGEWQETRDLCRLVRGTSPEFQSQCRWEAEAALDRYLHNYDHLHFAHRPPEEPFYPLLVPVPEAVQGIYRAKAWLRCLWLENQVLDAMPGARDLLDLAPPGYWEAPQNLCEQPLWNAMGKVLAGTAPAPLAVTGEERRTIAARLGAGDLPDQLEWALDRVGEYYGFSPGLRAYAQGAAESLAPYLEGALLRGDLGYLFWQ